MLAAKALYVPTKNIARLQDTVGNRAGEAPNLPVEVMAFFIPIPVKWELRIAGNFIC